MLGDSSSVLATTTTTPAGGGGGGGGGAGDHKEAPPLTGGNHEGSSNDVGGEEDKGKIEGDRSYGGSRWPRQETLALLKIRSGMDVAFRDASVKGPLWEEVSRKLAELGYNRSGKKCKEKFENVYKYHKRTKDGRTGKQEGKTYRFFDQLEAFESHPPSLSSPLSLPPQPPKAPTPAVTAIAMPVVNPSPNIVRASHSTVPSTAAATLATNMSQGIVTSAIINLTVPPFPSTNPTILPPSQATNPTNPPHTNTPPSFPNFSPDLISNSTSSSTSSDVELQERRKRKRKWKDFFERLMKEVIQKQEEMQKKFLEAIERREHERMVREESWRMQEMTRINREREILAQERSVAASKDAAVMAFLQKLSEEQNPGQIQNNPPPSQPPRPPAPPPILQLVPTPPPPLQGAQVPLPQAVANVDIIMKSDNGDQNFTSASPSRWPKVEVEALIRIRTNLDCKYQDNGPKGPLWEEISARMRKLGYNRNAKRCKEKWENINKYFKKVKESKKKRPEDSKTCPYFQQLDALYKEKNKIDGPSNMKPENSVPLMVRPEQQWPPLQQEHRPDSEMEDLESDDHQNHDDEDDKNMDDEDEEEDEASGYEVVANKQTSMNTDESEF